MIKDKILNLVKSKLFIGIVCFLLGIIIMSGSSGGNIGELENAISELNKQVTEKDNEIKKLQEKVDQAQPWFDMNEEERKAEEEKNAIAKAEKEAQEEAARKEEEAKKENRIGERVLYKVGSKGECALTIDSVQLTSERNQFADPVKNVVEISYTIENISMEDLDFFISNEAEFYDSEGFKCNSYPNSSGDGTYNIAKGKKASGKEFVGIEHSDNAYLEMHLGGNVYKWSL